MVAREEEWSKWMRAALAGDSDAYSCFLNAVAPYLRALALRQCQRLGLQHADAEDAVQEVLLAVHLKRDTWDASRPIGPWISTIVRHKMVDILRRRGRAVTVPIEDLVDVLEAAEAPDGLERRDVDRMLEKLNEGPRAIVRSISVDGASIAETATRLGMTEGAVRVALHRGLKALAALHRSMSK